MQSQTLSLKSARHIWLRAQKLDISTPFGAGPRAVRAAVEHLGYVQIDTINVIERCHHHILFTRIPDYQRADLRHAQSQDKSVFEYWTHALAYIPARDFGFFLPQMKRYRDQPGGWFAGVTAADLKKVMRLVRENGPISIRDIDDDIPVEKTHAWGSRKPSKRALELAFFMGRLTVSERLGMLKSYELMERHFAWPAPPKPATGRRIAAYLLDRALRSQGLVSLDAICHLDAKSKPGVAALIEARVRGKTLVPVQIEGAEKVQHWIAPELLETAPLGEPELTHILSPFDPLIIQRKRLSLIFGYDHLFEAYVPKTKRKLGYFSLPVLAGDEIVAALDLKTDRAAGKLLIQSWTWIGTGKERLHKCLIEAELDRFERFQLAQ